MPSVKLYLEKTQTVPVPAKFFLRPLQNHFYAVVRPMAKNQKYRSSLCGYPFPVDVWRKWSSRLPGEEPNLNLRRATAYGGEQGPLKPTCVTNTKEVWEYTFPAGRTAIIDNICNLQAKDSSRGMGAAKLVLPSRRARKKGATALSMSMACGPFWVKMTSPMGNYARKMGNIGKVRCKLWCGQLMFDEHLTFKYPEQEGSKTRSKNKYSAKQKAAIRKAALRNLKRMLDDPKYLHLDRAVLCPLVEAALKVVSLPPPPPHAHALSSAASFMCGRLPPCPQSLTPHSSDAGFRCRSCDF